MIIGTCGFGSTGSSVITDYLLEYNSFSHMDRLEFTWVFNVDGLIDLEYHLMNPHQRAADSIVAIKRYRDMVKRELRLYTKSGRIKKKDLLACVDEFLSKLVQVKWRWENPAASTFFEIYFKHYLLGHKVIPWLEKRKKRKLNPFFFDEVSLSVCPNNFYDAARTHVKDMLRLLGLDTTKSIVLDQPFSGNNPQACFPFFDDPYAIVVDRDPRDVYIFSKTALLGKNHYIPNDNVKDFVVYYRAIRDGQPYTKDDDRVMRIKFEDLVYNYDSSTERIRKFLGLGDNPRPKSIFDPSLSVANTRLYERFPKFTDDVKYIEEHCKEYLYDFSKYPSPKGELKMFYGKSPLNKGGSL